MTHFTRRSDWWLCNTFLLRCTNVHIHIYMTCSTHIELTLELLRIATQNNLKSADAVFQNTLCKSLYLIMHNKSPQSRYKFNDSVVYICQGNAILIYSNDYYLNSFFMELSSKYVTKIAQKIFAYKLCQNAEQYWISGLLLACTVTYIMI